MKKQLILNKISIIGFLGYFIFLLVERILAIALSYNSGEAYALANGNGMAITFYVITCVFVVLGTILFIKPSIGMCKKICTRELYDFKANYKSLVIASCVLLVSGMMHTGFTMSAIQFVAYGLLIAAMICATIDVSSDKSLRGKSIISLIYLTCFSMAIPVCYLTRLSDQPQASLFYAAELISAFVLIASFACMLLEFFEKGFTYKSVIFPLLVLVLDGLAIGLKWVDEINWFVLIFAGVTLVMYVVYIVYLKLNKTK